MFYQTTQLTLLGMNQCASSGFAITLLTRLPWIRIPNRLVKVATTADNRSPSLFLHLPILAVISQVLVSWRPKDLRISLYVASKATGLRASNRATEVEDIHRFWCLGGKKPCVAAVAECRGL